MHATHPAGTHFKKLRKSKYAQPNTLKEAKMKKKSIYYFVLFLCSLSLSGCLVTESKYLKKVAEADAQSKELASLKDQYEALTKENSSLKEKIKELTADRDQLKEAFATASKEKNELQRVLESKSDELTQNIVELRKKNSDLAAENKTLKENIAQLQKKKEEEVQSIKKAQDELLQEMKAEIAKGQITITELKGKLTLDVVEKILFDSGEAEVKMEGLEVLQRVVDILKNVKDRMIRVEGHTDNVPIKGHLAKKYPTNWELSAARAINVTRFLQKQGIDPHILSATAYGEYKPIADNSTPEGRAKNRRIAIVLQAKD